MKNFIPSYIKKYDFKQEAYKEFIEEPINGSQLDEYNNLVMSSNIEEPNIENIDKFLLKVAPRKNVFSETQVENFFDTNISEFSDIEKTESENIDVDITEFADEVSDEVGDQLANEKILQAQIDELSDALDREIQRGVKLQETSSETYQASRDLIISQRISAGEGTTESDFSEKFPFLPITEEEDVGDELPFMSSS